MLLSARVSKVFWIEDVSIIAYLINICPLTMLEMKTPEKICTGHFPILYHLRIFGYVAYSHISQGKLDAQVVKCIFLGYPEAVKGCHLWCLELGFKKCIMSGDVVFNETKKAYKLEVSKCKPKGSCVMRRITLRWILAKKKDIISF